MIVVTLVKFINLLISFSLFAKHLRQTIITSKVHHQILVINRIWPLNNKKLRKSELTDANTVAVSAWALREKAQSYSPSPRTFGTPYVRSLLPLYSNLTSRADALSFTKLFLVSTASLLPNLLLFMNWHFSLDCVFRGRIYWGLFCHWVYLVLRWLSIHCIR